jgi:apolipoprotein N-acyltransferase
MAFALDPKRAVLSVLAVTATAAMFYLGNGLDPLWPLMWFAPLPLMVLALRSRWSTAAVTAFLAMMLGSLNMWSYLTKTLGTPGTAWFEIFLTASVIFAAGILLFRTLVLRGAIWAGLLALPSTWVTSEGVRYLTSPHGTAGSLAYSQLKFLPFLQLASITGPWGMTFVLLLFPGAIAIAIHSHSTHLRRAIRVAGVALAVIAAILAFGAVRLSTPQTQTVKVGLITSDEKGNNTVIDPGPPTERLFRDYAREAMKLAAGGARAIVIPEKLGVTLQGKSAATDAIMQAVADQAGVTVVAGVVHVDAPVKFNEARIYTPGSPVQRYDKQHMLPPFESNLKPGTALTLLPQPQGKWGVAICKDMDFSSPARLNGEAGVGLMLVPAWDFVVDGTWHGHIAIMRGVEDGFSVARAAKDGFLTVSDSRGRIVGEVSSASAPFATLLVDVPAMHSSTLYQVWGDWFAWVAVALLVLCLLRILQLSLHSRQVVREKSPLFVSRS